MITVHTIYQIKLGISCSVLWVQNFAIHLNWIFIFILLFSFFTLYRNSNRKKRVKLWLNRYSDPNLEEVLNRKPFFFGYPWPGDLYGTVVEKDTLRIRPKSNPCMKFWFCTLSPDTFIFRKIFTKIFNYLQSLSLHITHDGTFPCVYHPCVNLFRKNNHVHLS